MKVALIGSSGYISKYLYKKFNSFPEIEIIKIGRSEEADEYLNLTEVEKFNYDCLADVKYIIFTSAVSGPDQCANNFQYSWSVNVTGTIQFIKEVIKREIRVLFFSSDAVFGDVPSKMYDELSETAPTTPYGKMKKTVEDEFIGSMFFKSIRLSYVVSSSDRFVSYCLDCIQKKCDVEVFHPFYRNCIVIDDVFNTVMWFLLNWDKYEHFVLNLAGKELVSRVRIVDELNCCLGDVISYKIVTPNKLFYKNRPAITRMKSLYLSKYGIIEDNTFSEKVYKSMEGVVYE